jgi:hypothetical protein
MRDRSRLAALALLGVSIGASMLLAEGTLRLVSDPRLERRHDERSLLYRYDAELGWFPTENGRSAFRGNRTIQVEHNADGFRDVPHGPRTKPRIAVLGDSFVWGYDVEAHARFTDLLARHRPDVEVLNLGVSGYGTDQEFLLLQRFFERYRPDLVVLVVSQQNDSIDNSVNLNYGGYYKPYFVVGDAALELRGVPVPRAFNYFVAEHPRLARSYAVRAAARLWFQRTAPPLEQNPDPTLAILEALRGYLSERGCPLRIGIHGGSTKLPYALELDGFRFVDLDNNYRFPEHGRHWTPEGHRYVASKLYDYLLSEKLLLP